MAVKIEDRKTVTQRTVNILWAVYDLALKSDYPQKEAMRVAIQAVERLSQGGIDDFNQQIRRIERGTATGGKAISTTFNRLVARREATKAVKFPLSYYFKLEG